MTITDPGHSAGPGPGPGSENSGTGRTKRRGSLTGRGSSLTGALGTMDFTARIGAVCAVLCTLLYLGCMTHTLADHRDWVGVAAFVVALVFAALALLTAAPHVIRREQPAAGLLPRVTMWGTGIVLAALQLTAAVLGDAEFSMVAVIGITTVLAVPCFGELAAQPGTSARGGRTGTLLGGSRRAPGAAPADRPVGAPVTAPAATPKTTPGSASATRETVVPPAADSAAATRETVVPPARDHVEPGAPAAGSVPPPPQERPVADRLRKSDRLSKTDTPGTAEPLSSADAPSAADPLGKTDRLGKSDPLGKTDRLGKSDPLGKTDRLRKD